MTRSRSAIVTGSTSGIGLAIARGLAAQGCNLVFNGFGDQSAIESLVADVATGHGVEAIHHPADVSKPAEVRALVASAEQRFGGVDMLINNAGIQHTAPIESFPDDWWDALIAVNLSAAFHAIKAVLPGMRQRNYGRIVNIASVHGLVGSIHKAAYVAAKHGLVGLTKVAALETADADITVNAICPGWVHTPLVQKQIEDRARETGSGIEEATASLLGEKQPKKRFVRPEDVAAMVVFLCGEAGVALTGEVLTLDGGWTAR